MIRVTIWNEYIQEKQWDDVRRIYPEGIHKCLESFLKIEKDITVQTATFDMPEHGLTEQVLQETDVLIWWGHCKHEEVLEDVVARVKKRVLHGMGLIALHSAHHSKIMKALLGTTLNLRWRHGDRERIWCTSPTHPIAKGLPAYFELDREEMYGEYFDIPTPDEVVFTGWFAGGEVFRSGVTFTRGLGKIFYFQPGHEEYPIYYQKEIRQIITNAVHYVAADKNGTYPMECIHVEESPEKKFISKCGNPE